MVDPKKPSNQEQEFIPTEEAILKELRQREKRKEYMTSDKAKANRQKYMKKRYVETKATRDAIKKLQETDPEKYAELMHKVGAAGK